jgi:hypothetical protein
VRRTIPIFAGAVAAVTDPSSVGDLVLIVIPVAAFAVWPYVELSACRARVRGLFALGAPVAVSVLETAGHTSVAI